MRRIEYADAKPPHLHLEFIRLGCSECLLWVSPFMRLGCSECLLWFSPGLRQDFAKTLLEFGNGVWRWEGLQIAPRRDKIAPRRTKNRAQIARGTPKSSPRASKTTDFKFFQAFLKTSEKKLKPKSAQERPKSCPGAPRRTPESPLEASQGTPGSPRGPF